MYDQLEMLPLGALVEGTERGPGRHTCLVCGEVFSDGEVYPVEGRFFDAATAARLHAQTAHGERLAQLLDGGSKYMTLTENQRQLLALLGQGKSDAEIAVATGVSPATVRRQRFAFREKAKQAKLYLAVYELAMSGKHPAKDALMPIHSGAVGADDRFVITRAENDKIVKNAFESTEPLRLRALPAREKKKVAVLNLIAGQFEQGRDYSEKQVNGILQAIQPDEYVEIRRYLITYGYLDREKDGSRYWRRQ